MVIELLTGFMLSQGIGLSLNQEKSPSFFFHALKVYGYGEPSYENPRILEISDHQYFIALETQRLSSTSDFTCMFGFSKPDRIIQGTSQHTVETSYLCGLLSNFHETEAVASRFVCDSDGCMNPAIGIGNLEVILDDRGYDFTEPDKYPNKLDITLDYEIIDFL